MSVNLFISDNNDNINNVIGFNNYDLKINYKFQILSLV